MNKRVLRATAWGMGGLLVAIVLTIGAFALAGQEISQPAGVPVFTSPSASRSADEDPTESPQHERTVTPTPDAGDDNADSSGPGGSDGDSSGHGSGNDSSGPGSGGDSSGSGSDESASGSDDDSSGSGSDGEHEDD